MCRDVHFDRPFCCSNILCIGTMAQNFRPLHAMIGWFVEVPSAESLTAFTLTIMIAWNCPLAGISDDEQTT